MVRSVTLNRYRCEICKYIEPSSEREERTHCGIYHEELTPDELCLLSYVGCASHSDFQNQKELWCGNCGFKESETCNDEITWKRCRLMSSEPEGSNVEDRLELARSSAVERVLDKLEQLLCAHHKYIGSYRVITGTNGEIYDEMFDAMQDFRKNGLVNK